MTMPQTRSGPLQARPGNTTPKPRVPVQADLLDLLWDGPIPTVERFRKFHAANPGVYRLLVRLTRDFLRRSGKQRLGINAVIERARWEYALKTTETPSINNSYAPFYSRLIMAGETDLAGVFETRRAAADDAGPAPGLASPPGGPALSASRTSHSGQSRDASRDVTRDETRD